MGLLAISEREKSESAGNRLLLDIQRNVEREAAIKMIRECTDGQTRGMLTRIMDGGGF